MTTTGTHYESPEAERAARIEGARKAAAESSILAQETLSNLGAEYVPAEASSAFALTSIALSLSAIATVLLATIDDEASR